MLTALLLSLAACSEEAKPSTTTTEDTASVSAVDSAGTVDSAIVDAICTQEQFCEVVQECFSVLNDEMCERYYVDDFGICSNATETQLEAYHTCICNCWLGEDDRTCMGAGTCSDFCGMVEC